MTRLLLMFCLLLPVSVTAAPHAPVLVKSDNAAIRKVLRDSEAGWNAGDIQTYMGSYWQSDLLRFASGGTVTYGWQATLDRYRAHYPDRETMGHLKFSDLNIRHTGSDFAMVFGSWRLEREKDEPHGLFTLVMRRFDAGWRIIHDHTSSAAE